MGVLEGIVVAIIVVAGAYVGYHAWQEWLHEPAEAHAIPGWPEQDPRVRAAPLV